MSRERLLGLTLLVMLASGQTSLSAPRERDELLAYVHDGQRYGYHHTTVTKLPDGNLKYGVDERVLVDLLGEKQETTGHSEWIVSPSYAIVSFSIKKASLSGRLHRTGRAKDGKLVVDGTGSGARRRPTLDISGVVIPDVCLDDWLNDLPAETNVATVKVFSRELLSIKPVSITRLPHKGSGSSWELAMRGAAPRTVRYDRRGLLMESKLTVPKVHMKRCTADQAKGIDYLKADGRYVLTFPISKQLPPPDRLDHMTVKLTWRDIPVEKFQLEDCRQRVVHKAQKDGKYEVTVKIERPDPVKAKTAYPIRDAKFAQYLKETYFIKPKDRSIVTLASDVTKGTTTALDAVKALSKWTSVNIRPVKIAETLSGPEVLKGRRGKCTEYATLFASLSRSLGIPTRIVLGDRIAGRKWVGHMWNEVYVGQWVPVDAAANEVNESWHLLKFTHSNTVFGTQALRWELTESLDVSLEDVQVKPSSLADTYKTGIRGRVYTNTDYACQLTAPGDNWKINDESAGGTVVVRFQNPETKGFIDFVAFSLPGQTEPKSLVDARMKLLKKHLKGYELIESKPREVGRAKGHGARVRFNSSRHKGTKITMTVVMWTHGSLGYLLKVPSKESVHDKELSSFNKVLESFEYLGRRGAP